MKTEDCSRIALYLDLIQGSQIECQSPSARVLRTSISSGKRDDANRIRDDFRLVRIAQVIAS